MGLSVPGLGVLGLAVFGLLNIQGIKASKTLGPQGWRGSGFVVQGFEAFRVWGVGVPYRCL